MDGDPPGNAEKAAELVFKVITGEIRTVETTCEKL